MPNGKSSSDSLEFEFTDLHEARHVLDLPPAGVIESRQLEPGYWASRRRSPTLTDRALSGDTMDWAMRLPSDLRPFKLCERFPRIANAIAKEWASRAYCESLFASLSADRRGKRRGFGAEVQRELDRLRAHRAAI
jgi:hypothetical protein